MTVRALNGKDLDYIASAINKGFFDGWNIKMLTEGFNAGRLKGFVASEGCKDVGFITYSTTVDSADIEDVFVETTERKKGFAVNLIERVVESVKSQNIPKIFLEVRASNIPAVNLYSKCGFSKISVRKKYYGDGEDALIMIKEL